MDDINDTTQTFPRQAGNFHPDQVSIYGPFTPERKSNGTAEFWVCIVIAFACGFLTHLLWGAR